MSRQKLSEEEKREKRRAYQAEYYKTHPRKTKTSPAAVARYTKKNYTAYTIRVRNEVAERIDTYVKRKQISRPEFLRRAIDILEQQE